MTEFAPELLIQDLKDPYMINLEDKEFLSIK